MPQHTDKAKAPLKLIDIKAMLDQGIRGATPNSLAFFLGSQLPTPASLGIDPRRIAFNDVSPQLRDQRQRQAAGQPNNPFSLFGAINNLNRIANTPK